MAYFNHAFTKVFVGTQVSGNGAGQNPNPNLTNGFLTLAGVPTVSLTQKSSTPAQNYGVGSFGFFNPKTGYQSVDLSYVSGNSCCPLVLASAALYQNDKIGPFHGGYQETNKSKLINPKFIREFYRVDPCTPQNNVVHIGNTPYTASGIATLTLTDGGTGYTDGVYTNVPLIGGTGSGATANITIVGGIITIATIVGAGIGYTVADVLVPDTAIVGTPTGAAILTVATVASTNAACCFEFQCNETYYLRIDVKGSPALRFLNHNAYQTLPAPTGCCPDPNTPSVVDSTLVMIAWANEIINNPYMKDFIQPVVVAEDGTIYYAPGTPGVANTWDTYVSPGHVADQCAGLILYGAYMSTVFGDCSFQPSDYFEKEPVKILASMVDYTGDPCVFEGICVIEECPPRQGQGFGETVLRDLIKSESYLQNYFHTDIRIREITQGSDILAAINRASYYTRYFILHSVPRYNNPTGVFDNDQYMLEIITTGTNAALEAFMAAWLGNCTDCVSLTVYGCDDCTPMTPQFPVG